MSSETVSIIKIDRIMNAAKANTAMSLDNYERQYVPTWKRPLTVRGSFLPEDLRYSEVPLMVDRVCIPDILRDDTVSANIGRLVVEDGVTYIKPFSFVGKDRIETILKELCILIPEGDQKTLKLLMEKLRPYQHLIEPAKVFPSSKQQNNGNQKKKSIVG